MLRLTLLVLIVFNINAESFAASQSFNIDSLVRGHLINYDSFFNQRHVKPYRIVAEDSIALLTDTFKFYRVNIISTDFMIIIVESKKHRPAIMSAGYSGREFPNPQLGKIMDVFEIRSRLTEMQLSSLCSKFLFRDNFVVFSIAENKLFYDGKEVSADIFNPGEYSCSFVDLHRCSIQNNPELNKTHGKLDILVISLFDSRVNCRGKLAIGCRTGRIWLSKSKLQFRPLNNSAKGLLEFIGHNDARVGAQVNWTW